MFSAADAQEKPICRRMTKALTLGD